MGFSTKFSNGWQVAQASFKVLNANKELIIFPILSGVSLALILGSFLGVAFGVFNWNVSGMRDIHSEMRYLIIFGCYVVNYFVVVFFNMALMHCAKLYFDGEPVSIAKGLRFGISRIHTIFIWAVFAATVGTAIRILQDNLGWLGKIITGLLGIVWSVATFFILPVLAYEKLGPADAVKRSAAIMKERWGEGIGANFSIGLIGFVVILLVAIVAMAISALINEQAGIVIFVTGLVVIVTIGSTLHSIFIMAIYNQVTGNDNDQLDKQMVDNLFVQK